jgi:tetratricopeptide (TPR) repeat protein
LALATAGAYLKESPFSFSKYLQQYEAKWEAIASIEELADYPTRTLYTTWDLSFTRIKQQNAQAAQLLSFLAYLDHRDIWYDLFCGYRYQGTNAPAWFTQLTHDEYSFEKAMRTLVKYCLAEAHYQAGSYSLHVCVHDWTLDGLNRDINGIHYWLAFGCVAGHLRAGHTDHLSNTDYLSEIRYQRFTAHANRLVHNRFRRVAGQQDSTQTRLDQIQFLAELLYKQVQYNAAEQMYLLALAGKEQALGPDHTSTLDTVNNLGNLYLDQGKLAEAEQMSLRALAGFEKALGPDHTSTLGTVNNLGNLYADQGKLAEAEQMYLRALAGYEKALGPDHSSTLDTVNNLGLLYGDQRKLAEAEQMYLRALAGKEKALGPDHSSTLDTVNNLGLLYGDQGKLAEAEQMYLRALAGKEKALGPDHTSTLMTVNNLGTLYRDQEKLAEAEQIWLRALAGCWDLTTRRHSTPSIISVCYIVTKVSWPRRSRCTYARWPGTIRRWGLTTRRPS